MLVRVATTVRSLSPAASRLAQHKKPTLHLRKLFIGRFENGEKLVELWQEGMIMPVSFRQAALEKSLYFGKDG